MTQSDKHQKMSEARIAEILKKVNARAKPSAEMSAAIKSQVKDVWQEEVSLHKQLKEQKQTKQRNGWLAVAASVTVAVGAGFLFNLQPDPVYTGSVAQVVGTVEYRSPAQPDWQPLEPSIELLPDTDIRSAAGSYSALSLSNGMTLRLDENSMVQLSEEAQVYLSQGGLYAESDETMVGQSITVTTAFGRARDIGTEFEVRVTANDWRVQVREGLVAINDGQLSETATAGQRLSIAQDQTFQRTLISSADTSWQWTNKVHQPFVIEGAKLSDYLSWWSDETGRQVIFKNTDDALVAASTILHGSMHNLTVADSLAVVLSTTRFEVVDSAPDQVILAR
ncbi:MAG: ferric-dicitrate binding protein FerR (iron transport regulator) [Candidatus Azotimanducaceae bacterium]|jgi:ferric-dicitrate binding protein FerR (iron transport regulator)